MNKSLSYWLLMLSLVCGAVQAGAPDARTPIAFGDLPLNLAVKQVRGNGQRIFATFEDPNCGYCKKLAKEIQGMTDVTIYTFMYPILSSDSGEKSKAIWCAHDKAGAWNDWMINGKEPTAGKGKCDAPNEQVVSLGRKLKVRATPTLFLVNGERITGMLSKMELEMAISSPKVLSYQVNMTRKGDAARP